MSPLTFLYRSPSKRFYSPVIVLGTFSGSKDLIESKTDEILVSVDEKANILECRVYTIVILKYFWLKRKKGK